jgi:hypothetical protein
VKKALLLKSTLALALATPLLASAESQLVNGAGSATARLDFRVIIPRVLFLGVGAGSATLANNPGIDLVSFDYTNNPSDVGGGVTAPALLTSGAVVPVRVVGNNGVITLSASTVGALSNGAGDTIPWTQISATSALAALPSPTIPASGTGAGSAVTVSSGTKITDRSTNWTFSYANAAVVPAGTYGATVANNSRVTYTASMP